MNELERVKSIFAAIKFEIFSTTFSFRVEHDMKNPEGRIFIQACYTAPCATTGKEGSWTGRKWYLSEHMTEDEIVKTAFAACKAAVEHEVMEGFTVTDVKVFNPHVNYKALMEASKNEIKRNPMS